MVLIFRGLRSALWLPIKFTVCAPLCSKMNISAPTIVVKKKLMIDLLI